ncbi:signal recognition particle-docking protein FtsY [Caloramator sp. Dgby_cultured_2]|uniref:signal recognition particle-docking protein FtsY n=2 Tax=Caloramator sp. Dgby_cultured_2 TaxID=3029174 RepID=UPI00237E9C8E|nr:signal recognition particle-docking protein FtsY [Caloramator sp. Dgby_cultured_2]WDU84464.1 signal recognition particle-docking protein FtsY [Caloramator sp. Dgby_cultured_2]
MAMGWFEKLKEGLVKTRDNLVQKVDAIFSLNSNLDEEFYEELEEALIMSDVGVKTTQDIIEMLRKNIKDKRISDPEDAKEELKNILMDIMQRDKNLKIIPPQFPAVFMVVGVNGVGKTTSIGKLAHFFKSKGYKVLLAAADTFRAAAIDQLEVWGQRVGVDVIKHQEGSDPAAVVFDALQAAKARKADILICDTAGRLHNKKNLMEELRKINKVIEREGENFYKETFLILDATTGQNALLQAKEFMDVSNVNGIILTKLDGTAKGGIVIGISNELNVPVKMIGVGEGIEDLQEFNPEMFVKALFDSVK